jgi:signal transduction histidine kinase
VRLDEILRGVHRQMQHHKPETPVRLEPAEPTVVFGSRDALQELLLILVDNALKYTPAGGEVTLGVERRDGEYALRVRDTGVGIAPEDLPHIFERFYRATHVRQHDGTGLGLAIAHWIAEQHGGRITVESALRQGSTFTVWLPIPAVEPAPAPAATASSAEPAAAGAVGA